MPRLLILIGIFFVVGCSQSPPEPVVTLTPEEISAAAAEQFDTLQSDFKAAKDTFAKEVRNAPREERMALVMSGGPQHEFAAKHLQLATEYLETDTAFPALRFAAEHGATDVATEAFDTIVGKFADHEALGSMLTSFLRTIRVPGPHHEEFLQRLAESSPDRSIQGNALFAWIKLVQSVSEMKEMASDPEAGKALPPESLAYLLQDRGDNLAEQLEEKLVDLQQRYGDVTFGAQSLNDLAEDELYVYRHLSVGKTAPEIEGIDLDGEPFKLSDYRGKVVMLDFWGDW